MEIILQNDTPILYEEIIIKLPCRKIRHNNNNKGAKYDVIKHCICAFAVKSFKRLFNHIHTTFNKFGKIFAFKHIIGKQC
jgi:hypothetical protein